MQVKDIMTPDPVCCTPETNLATVARMMVENDCGEIPVVENKASKLPIGVVTDRDIICRIVASGLNPLERTAGDAMSKTIITITPDMSLEECTLVLEQNRIRRVPVVDDRGSCCGIVSVADIALQSRKQDVAAELLQEVSVPTASASATGR